MTSVLLISNIPVLSWLQAISDKSLFVDCRRKKSVLIKLLWGKYLYHFLWFNLYLKTVIKCKYRLKKIGRYYSASCSGMIGSFALYSEKIGSLRCCRFTKMYSVDIVKAFVETDMDRLYLFSWGVCCLIGW